MTQEKPPVTYPEGSDSAPIEWFAKCIANELAEIRRLLAKRNDLLSESNRISSSNALAYGELVAAARRLEEKDTG